MIKRFWTQLDPNKKRWVSIAGGVFVLFAVVTMFSGEPKKEEKRGRQETIKHVLTDKNTREIGIDSLSADVKMVSRENSDLKKELERVKKELEEPKTTAGKSSDVGREMTRLRQDLDRLTQKNMELAKKVETGAAGGKTSSSSEDARADVNGASGGDGQFMEKKLDYKDPASFFRDAPLPDSKGGAPATGKGDGRDATKPGIQIVSYSQKAPEVEEKDNKDDESIYLPSGSILTGVLINGMDAPTSQGARRDPFPSTLRIQKEAILPNRFRADVRECFLIVSGYGDLSSERAYLRGETFSCVRDDGGVIEAKLDSYAVGEDGKAGVRGRVVSKQGQIIAKSLMAGFLGGVSEAFDVNPVPVVSTNPGSNTQYQSVFSDQMLQGAAVKGASKALDRIAQFYIDMAEGIFPVIEVDAGRQVDIIVTKGTKLQIRSTGGTKK
ncbi:TraB/VirB10 family protein [Salmonella enterica]|uniref:TraB/VirB10 family protein n=1 Tax=Salmonella enterica TaxID=28901 RepID=UPI000BE2FC07|nr:conjugal transfer protein TraB [Salmonella enterica]